MKYLCKPLSAGALLLMGVLALSGSANASMIVSVTNNGNVEVYAASVDLVLPDGTRMIVGEGEMGYPILGGFFLHGSELSLSNPALPGETAQTPSALDPLVPGAMIGSIHLSGSNGASQGGFVTSSNVTLGPSTTVIQYDSEFSDFVFQGQFTFTTVPEPSTLALFGVALLGLGAWVHKRRIARPRA